MMPNRDDSKVMRHFGPEVAARLLPVIKALEDDFYRSNARAAADNLGNGNVGER